MDNNDKTYFRNMKMTHFFVRFVNVKNIKYLLYFTNKVDMWILDRYSKKCYYVLK